MKTIIIFCTLLFCSFAFAGEWIPRSAIKPPHSITDTKSVCETKTGEDCFDKAGRDMRGFKLGFRPIDVNGTTDCTDLTDCSDKLVGTTPEFSCIPGELAKSDDKVNWPSLDFTTTDPPRLNTGWFLWCEAEAIVPDPAGQTQADADDAQQVSDNAARATAATQRVIDMDSCVTDTVSATMTLPQVSACVRALVREKRGSAVPIGDL